MAKNEINISGGTVSIGKLAVGDGSSIVNAPGPEDRPSSPRPFSIFLSYRRSDSQDVTGRIYDYLTSHFSKEKVFKDVDSIPLAEPFPQYLQHVLENVNVALAVIGPTWLSAANERGGRRLDDAEDFVRMEIETALRLNVAVIPIIVSHATMPAAPELPEAIRDLAYRHGQAVRPDPDFRRDMEHLVQELQKAVGSRQ